MGIHSKKCVGGQFHHCVNITGIISNIILRDYCHTHSLLCLFMNTTGLHGYVTVFTSVWALLKKYMYFSFNDPPI